MIKNDEPDELRFFFKEWIIRVQYGEEKLHVSESLMKPVYTLAGRFFRLLGNLPVSTQKQLSAVMLVKCVGGKLRLNVTCH